MCKYKENYKCFLKLCNFLFSGSPKLHIPFEHSNMLKVCNIIHLFKKINTKNTILNNLMVHCTKHTLQRDHEKWNWQISSFSYKVILKSMLFKIHNMTSPWTFSRFLTHTHTHIHMSIKILITIIFPCNFYCLWDSRRTITPQLKNALLIELYYFKAWF